MLLFKHFAKYLCLRRSEFLPIFQSKLPRKVSADLLHTILKWNEKVFLLRNLPSLAVFVIFLPHYSNISSHTFITHSFHFGLIYWSFLFNLYECYQKCVQIIINTVLWIWPLDGKMKSLLKGFVYN